MGLLDLIKRTYTEEYDLENLEDLVYDDEQLDFVDKDVELPDFPSEVPKKMEMSELFQGFDISEKKEKEKQESKKDNKSKKVSSADKKKQSMLEEEKYDHMLNSVQAQDLIKAVESYDAEKPKKNSRPMAKSKPKEEIKPKETSIDRIIEQKEKEVVIFTPKEEPVQVEKVPQKEKTLVREKTVKQRPPKKEKPVLVVEKEEDKEQKKVREFILPDVNRKPKKLEKVNTDNFKTHDIELFVKTQCDIMEEAAGYVEKAKAEYEAVTEEFNDIQLLEDAPKELNDRIVNAAERVDSLTVDRRIYRSTENKLSNNAYRRMEVHEEEIDNGLKLLKKQEEYFSTVQNDMRMVEGERLGLRMEAKGLVKRQLRIRSLALLSAFALAIVFMVFFIAMSVTEDEDNSILFVVVATLSAFLAVGMFALLKSTERQVLVTEIKLNKATSLLNKIKIKYINAANTLDYEYNKYDVKSSYEFEKKYQMYSEMKDEQKKMVEMTSSLNDAELELENALKQLGLFDPHVWIGRAKALFNPKEMVEVRHDLNVRRQKLRNQIEYNEGRIIEAKDNIKDITMSNPKYAQDALKVIEMYERRHR